MGYSLEIGCVSLNTSLLEEAFPESLRLKYLKYPLTNDFFWIIAIRSCFRENRQEKKAIIFLSFFKGKLKHPFHSKKAFAVSGVLLPFLEVNSTVSCDTAAFIFLFVYIISYN